MRQVRLIFGAIAVAAAMLIAFMLGMATAEGTEGTDEDASDFTKWLIWVNAHDLVEPPQLTYVAGEWQFREDWGAAVEQWRPLVAGHFPPEAVETMLCLMWHESRGNTYADNPNSTARGLMQVLRGWADHFGVSYTDLYNPSINLWISRKLYDDNTYWHWSPYLRGECRGL